MQLVQEDYDHGDWAVSFAAPTDGWMICQMTMYLLTTPVNVTHVIIDVFELFDLLLEIVLLLWRESILLVQWRTGIVQLVLVVGADNLFAVAVVADSVTAQQRDQKNVGQGEKKVEGNQCDQYGQQGQVGVRYGAVAVEDDSTDQCD